MKAIISLHIGAAMRNCKKKADKAHQKAPCRGRWMRVKRAAGRSKTNKKHCKLFYNLFCQWAREDFDFSP